METKIENGSIANVPSYDWLEIDADGKIYLHMDESMTPEQLQLIVDFAKARAKDIE